MIRKPLLTPGRRGLSGSFMSSHAGIGGLSKSINSASNSPNSECKLILDDTNSMLVDTAITAIGDDVFTITVVFEINTTGQIQYIIDGEANFDFRMYINASDRAVIELGNNVNAWTLTLVSTSTIAVGTKTTIQFVSGGTAALKINTVQEAIEPHPGDTITIKHLGTDFNQTNDLNGSIYSASFDNTSTPADTTYWTLDEVQTVRIKSNHASTTKDLVLTGVTTNSWNC